MAVSQISISILCMTPTTSKQLHSNCFHSPEQLFLLLSFLFYSTTKRNWSVLRTSETKLNIYDLRLSQQWLYAIYIFHWKSSSVLQQHFTSILRVKEWAMHAVCIILVSCLSPSSTLEMWALCSSKILASFQWTMRNYIPENWTPQNWICFLDL